MNTFDLHKHYPPDSMEETLLSGNLLQALLEGSRGLVYDNRTHQVRFIEGIRPIIQLEPAANAPLMEMQIREACRLAALGENTPDSGHFLVIVGDHRLPVTVRHSTEATILSIEGSNKAVDAARAVSAARLKESDRYFDAQRKKQARRRLPTGTPFYAATFAVAASLLTLAGWLFANGYPLASFLALSLAILPTFAFIAIACHDWDQFHRNREVSRIPTLQAARKPLSARDFAAACHPPVPVALVDRVREALSAGHELAFLFNSVTVDPTRIRPNDGLVPPTRLRPSSFGIEKLSAALVEEFGVPISPKELLHARTAQGVVRLVAGKLAGTEGSIVP